MASGRRGASGGDSSQEDALWGTAMEGEDFMAQGKMP